VPGSLRRMLRKVSARGKWAAVRWLVRLRIVWIMLIAGLMLSGCVRYETGITFNTANQGTIIQHIQLSNRLTALNGGDLQRWWRDLDRQARSLQGRVVALSNRDVVVTIPFYSGPDLVEKFKTFLAPLNTGLPQAGSLLPDLPTLPFEFELNQQNFLFLIRNRLTYDLDLTDLDPSGSVAAGNSLLNGAIADLVALNLRLTTPWGARAIVADATPSMSTASLTLASMAAPRSAIAQLTNAPLEANDPNSAELAPAVLATEMPEQSQPTSLDLPSAGLNLTDTPSEQLDPKLNSTAAVENSESSDSAALTLDRKMPEAIPSEAPKPTESPTLPETSEPLESSPNLAPEEIGPKILVPTQQDGSLVWTLIPGRVNHLEAVFWLPNPVGIGSVLIVLAIVAGYSLKYGFPGRSQSAG